MNKIEVKKRYRELEAQRKYNFIDNAKKVIEEMELTCQIDDVLEIGLKLEGDELQKFITKHNLSCPICNTAEHLICAPVVYDPVNGIYTKKIEIYCNNTDPDSSIFKRCWRHVYGYYYGIDQGAERCMEFSK